MVNCEKMNTSDKSTAAKNNEESNCEVKIEENVKNIGKTILFVKSDFHRIQIQGFFF